METPACRPAAPWRVVPPAGSTDPNGRSRRCPDVRAWGLGCLARQRGGNALFAGIAILLQRADHAGRIARGADGRAQIHHRLRIISGPVARGQRFRQTRQFRLGAGQRCLDGKQPRDDALDIAVHDGFGLIIGNRGNSGRGIGADSGQLTQSRPRPGKATPGGHRACAGHQVACPGIISKPGPFGHDLGIIGGGQIADSGPARGETLEIGPDRSHGGLLQHHLGQPDPIGIGGAGSRPHPPGQIAGVPVIPVQKLVRDHLDVTQISALVPCCVLSSQHPAD